MTIHPSAPQRASAFPGRLSDLWRRLTEPAASVPESQRFGARVLSGWLLASLALDLLLGIPVSLTRTGGNPLRTPIFWVTLVALLILVLAYALNHVGAYSAAAALTVILTSLGTWAAVIANTMGHGASSPTLILTFASLSIFLSSLLLSVRATILLAAAHLVGAVLFPIFLPSVALVDLTTLLIFISLVSLLIVVTAVIREQNLARIEQQARALSDSRQQLQAILDNSPTIVYLKDTQGHYLLVNRRYETVFRLTRAQILGKTSADLFPQDAADAYWANDLKVLQTGVPLELEETVSHPDGVHTYVSVKFPLYTSAGEPYAVCSMSTDITARQQAEAALRDSELRFRNLFENSPDAVFVEDFEGSVLDVNAAACRLNGMAYADLVGTNVLELIPADLREGASHDFLRMVKGEIDYLEGFSQAKDGRGRVVPVEIRVSHITYSGKPALLLQVRDITARKRVEAALQEANAKLTTGLAEAEQRTREIALLNEMSDLLQTCLTAGEAYNVISRLARQLFPDEAGAVYVIGASRNVVEAVATWGSDLSGERVFEPNDCWALRRGRLHLGEDISRPDGGGGMICNHLPPPRPTAYLCVPMMAQGEALGILHLQITRSPDGAPDSRPRHFIESKQRLAETVADSLALALANLKLRETLRSQSIRDPLTGLFNRRYLEETLEREVRRAMRGQQPLGIIMLDLDHFKRFNDTFGHEAGDALLRELGVFLGAHIRAEDIACRYGGEEFTLILPEASLEATGERAAHLRAEAQHLHAQHRGQPLGAVTLSLGVAVFPDHGSTGEAVLRAADAALYRAKHEGRDRVVVAA